MLYRVGDRGLKILRPDQTLVQWPPGALVNFSVLPAQYEGELTAVEPDPKHGVYENKQRRAKEDKERTEGGSQPRTGQHPPAPPINVPDTQEEMAPCDSQT